MGRPTAVGTHGRINFVDEPSGEVQVRTRFRDYDGRVRMVTKVGRSRAAVERASQVDRLVVLSARGMDVPMVARVTFASPDRVRDVIHNFNADGFDSLQPRYAASPAARPSSRNREATGVSASLES